MYLFLQYDQIEGSSEFYGLDAALGIAEERKKNHAELLLAALWFQ
jgi:hypothetical protein